jgi:hypothetical protein
MAQAKAAGAAGLDAGDGSGDGVASGVAAESLRELESRPELPRVLVLEWR